MSPSKSVKRRRSSSDGSISDISFPMFLAPKRQETTTTVPTIQKTVRTVHDAVGSISLIAADRTKSPPGRHTSETPVDKQPPHLQTVARKPDPRIIPYHHTQTFRNCLPKTQNDRKSCWEKIKQFTDVSNLYQLIPCDHGWGIPLNPLDATTTLLQDIATLSTAFRNDPNPAKRIRGLIEQAGIARNWQDIRPNVLLCREDLKQAEILGVEEDKERAEERSEKEQAEKGRVEREQAERVRAEKARAKKEQRRVEMERCERERAERECAEKARQSMCIVM